MQGEQVTSTGARAMTPGYSPPEQYGTARTDVRSDIYSLGATLYATLTGVIPEDGFQRMTGKVKLTSIRDLVPRTNRRLAETIERALEVDPEDRWQTSDEFKRALVEAGELAPFFQERPSIPPPPIAPGGEVIVDLAASQARRRELASRRKGWLRQGWALLPAAAGLLAAAYLLFMLRPDWTARALAFVSGASSSYPTEVHSEQTLATGLRPPDSTANPGAIETQTTPAPILIEPTLEPTITLTPAPQATFTPTITPQGGGSGQIAFASDKIGVMEVWLIDVNNPQKQRQLTDRQDGACQPTWSPDGMRLAFISPCLKKQETYPGANIFIINVDAEGNPDRSSLVQITSSLEGAFDPAWSPDGNRIAYTSLSEGGAKSSIQVVNLNDLSTVELSNSKYSDKQPTWAPSGMRLAFVRKNINNQIWVMTDSGSPQYRLTYLAPVNNTWPAWSNDESVIFYSQTGSDTVSTVPVLVYMRHEDRDKPNKENRVLPASVSGKTSPIAEISLSPDGNWMAYEGWPDGENHDIYIMSLNGSNQTRLTTDHGFDFGAAWRPLKPAQ
jgi:Tol biopolymer transport system component